ncbi:MAG: hypothetical protein ACI924_000222 [Flavobacterium sp.]|jgi:hypothetical protein
MLTNTEDCKPLMLTSVNCSDFRIVEFKGNFRIQKKQLIDEWFYFMGIALWVKGQKETWNYILKNNSILAKGKWSETKNYQFETKQECLDWIYDVEKYPVYHYC